MILYGASGHGKVIREILESVGVSVDAFIDDNTDLSEFNNLQVRHSLNGEEDVIVSIGSNKKRKAVVERLLASGLNVSFVSAKHKYAVISASAMIGEGSVVMAGAVINADAKIGKHCIINTSASVDHDCFVGDFAHISPHATLCGNVTIGEGTWIGAGATIIQGITIGKGCVIGAGSVVSKNIPDGYLAVGNRCKLIKRID